MIKKRNSNLKSITMKKITLTLKMLLVFVSVSNMNAQIINGSFENLRDNFFVSNWGKNYIYNVGINPVTGESTSDEILFSGYMPSICYSNFGNCHSGQYAMEMANAFNATQNQMIVGGAVLFEDETQIGPPGGNYNINTSFVPFNASLFNSYYGYNLGFYYKFYPLGSDIAEATLELFDSELNSVGKVAVPISGVSADFDYVYAPVNLTSTNTPTFMSLSFTMAKEGSTPTFGSTLIVDDVFINNMTLGTVMNQVSQFSIYPTVAQNEINIHKGNKVANGKYDFNIVNAEGKIVQKASLNLTENDAKIDVSQLSSGMYIVKSENFVGKFIKE
jgi:Secretion system C-terminal sorting domain